MRSSTTPYRPTRNRLVLLLALAVLMAATLATSEAQAQTAALSVRVIHAGNGSGGVGGSLSSMASQLQSRFSSYSSFRQQSSHSVSVSVGNTRSVTLPNRQSMTISLQSVSGSSYRLAVSLPGGGTTVTVSPGGRFFVAGPSYNGGILIIAISL